jgi:hypothetical protein
MINTEHHQVTYIQKHHVQMPRSTNVSAQDQSNINTYAERTNEESEVEWALRERYCPGHNCERALHQTSGFKPSHSPSHDEHYQRGAAAHSIEPISNYISYEASNTTIEARYKIFI